MKGEGKVGGILLLYELRKVCGGNWEDWGSEPEKRKGELIENII